MMCKGMRGLCLWVAPAALSPEPQTAAAPQNARSCVVSQVFSRNASLASSCDGLGLAGGALQLSSAQAPLSQVHETFNGLK